jgi:hypothetical protein
MQFVDAQEECGEGGADLADISRGREDMGRRAARTPLGGFEFRPAVTSRYPAFCYQSGRIPIIAGGANDDDSGDAGNNMPKIHHLLRLHQRERAENVRNTTMTTMFPSRP